MAMGGRAKYGAVAVVLGTRPELVKLAPLIKLLGDDSYIIHTGQHYSDGLYGRVVTDLELAQMDNLGLGAGTRGAQLGRAVSELDFLFVDRQPAAVLVQGDTTSALAGALAANARGIPLVHVEAGLRSYDRNMPEEHNRVLIDHLADRCCAPTLVNRSNLLRENIPAERIEVTGNTVVEALRSALPDQRYRDAVLDRYRLRPSRYVLATFHRPENVDDPDVLATVLTQLAGLPVPVVLPLHPRTGRRVCEFGVSYLLSGLLVTEPLSYQDFLALAGSAAVLVSDSGGIQEEASVLKRPVIVVRRSSERPEIDGTFGTLVAPGPRVGEVVRSWLADLDDRHARLASLPSPYGDGSASRTIAAMVRAMTAPDAPR